MNYEFERFYNRTGFNNAVGHFRGVSSIIDDFEDLENIADVLNDLVEDKDIEEHQINPTLYALLVDKYGYSYISHNLTNPVEDFSSIWGEVARWKAVDLVAVYYHPELGVTVINPKRREHWETVQSLKRNELITVYAGAFDNTKTNKIYDSALDKFVALIEGKKVKTPAVLTKGNFTVSAKKAPGAAAPGAAAPAEAAQRRTGPVSTRASLQASRPKASAAGPAVEEQGEEDHEAKEQAPVQTAPQAPAAPSAPKRMTPMYSVPVTNELFHNGNVEAWKKIIDSYQVKHPGLDVYIYYDGEQIHDINTLFKWGKVKHGSSILYRVAGEEIKNVAKLQRYLKQGASSRFEDFLRFPVNKVLDLF